MVCDKLLHVFGICHCSKAARGLKEGDKVVVGELGRHNFHLQSMPLFWLIAGPNTIILVCVGGWGVGGRGVGGGVLISASALPCRWAFYTTGQLRK